MSIAAPRRRLATGGLLVAVLAVLAGASFVVWQREDDGGRSGQTAESGPSSTLEADAPPALHTTGEDWDAIVRSIGAYQAWLFTHPKPELLDNIFLPSFSGYGDAKLGLTNLATKGWRYEPTFRAATVTLVRLFERPGADTAAVFVRASGPSNRIVDSSGNVIQDNPGAGDTAVLWTLKRNVGGDDRWRLEQVMPFTDTPPRP